MSSLCKREIAKEAAQFVVYLQQRYLITYQSQINQI